MLLDYFQNASSVQLSIPMPGHSVAQLGKVLRCFDTVFQRLYLYFSIALKVVFSLSGRYNVFTSNLLWIKICEKVVLSKIDITMTTMNKKN